MKKTLFIFIAIVALVLIVVFLQKSKQQYVVRVANLPIIASKLSLAVAEQKGFFEQEGVLVEIIELASSNLVSDGLLRGDIDITSEISLIPFLNANNIDPGKIQIFSVTDLTANAPFDSILVKANSLINDVNGLAGKKIGVFAGTTATNMLKLFLQQKGIDSSEIQFIQLPAGEQLPALAAGSIDALFAYEPTVSVALADGNVRKIFGSVYADQLDHNPIGGGLVNAQFVQDHPREAEKVIRALNRAYDFMRTNEAESREIAMAVFKFNPAVAETVALPYFRHSSAIDKNTVNDFLNLLVTAGELKSKPDLANAFYR